MSLQVEKTGFEFDNLFAGTQVQPVVADEATIATGAGVLARGTVLGRITIGGKCVAVNSTLSYGAQTVFAVLAEGVDASLSDVKAPVYLTGEFNEDALAFGGPDTAGTHRVKAREIGLFFKSNIPA
jgi:hypothetical protein